VAEVHPVRLVVSDANLTRSRLTTAFRLILAIPHVVWLALWGFAVLLVTPVQWIVTLVRGRPAEGLHGFVAAFVRYGTQFYAYLLLAANPYPGFTGGAYVVDLELPPPERQSRLKTLFRLFLALPALVVLSLLVGLAGGSTPPRGKERGVLEWLDLGTSGGIAFTFALLGWFAILARGRMPRGFRDFVAYALRYAAQTWAYVLLLTDRYPNFGPDDPCLPGDLPTRSTRLRVEDDLRRSRLTVFFRLPLVFPHLVWLVLWGIAAFLAALANWVATFVRGRSPSALHRFLSAYVRYTAHVGAFLFLVANPFPGFTGAPGYPVDIEIDEPAGQRRVVTAFRFPLALPAFLVASSLGLLLFAVGWFGWFASLALGRMPLGLRNAGAYVIGYSAQVFAYGSFVLTDEYPYSGPLPAAQPDAEPEEEPRGGNGPAGEPALAPAV
jgi:hypothetical protein